MMSVSHLDALHSYKEWKWLFMNVCKCKSLIYMYTMTEFLNTCQDVRNASVCSGIIFYK